MTDAATIDAIHPGEPEQIACFNPATGQRLGQRPSAGAQGVTDAVSRARSAQLQWAKSSYRQRRAVLQHIIDHTLEHVDELCAAIVEDSGKTFENALLGEVMPVCNKIRWLIKYGEKHLKPEKVPSGLLMHKAGRIEYRPLGVVACIVPWNYPFQNIFGSLVAPLMAGNSVVLKVSEALAWSSARFQQVIDEALTREGFSTDTVQIINGHGETGAALVRSGVDKILFIGSVNNGRRIIEGSAEHLTPVVMELGGKDPLIVCDDANLERAVHAALGGCFINLGQNCIASERVIVNAAVHDAFVAEVGRLANAMRQGVPQHPGALDVGSITTPQQLAIIDALVEDAKAAGARVVAGGRKGDGPGNFYPPTVLADITPDMRIATQEVFGPVMCIMRVDSDAQAVELANATELGLQSSVFSRDQKRAERIAAQLQTGATSINDFGLCYLNQDLPFGGVKYSGFGRMNGRDGLRAYTNAKAVLKDRFGFGPAAKLYPVGPHDYVKARSTIRLLFTKGLGNKLRALTDLIRISLQSGTSKPGSKTP